MSFFGKISTKEHYGLRLALQVAGTYYSQIPISLQKISDEEKISMKYLEQLIVPLRESGWVKSIRGRDGGYLMIVDPKRITLKDLISSIDKNIFIIDCLNGKCSQKCPMDETCLSKKAWQKVQESLEKTMQKIKISELLHK
ncbi:MAG: Rrf2 family transcriptional regulator [Candidatus Gracilibacteria bacterium]|nr:Rrf2 family transcriptional regulator [Candidatus Gracilibacteria bacterium]